MTTTKRNYTMKTNNRNKAHIIARVALAMKLPIRYKCNKETHKVEFQIGATPNEFKTLSELVLEIVKQPAA